MCVDQRSPKQDLVHYLAKKTGTRFKSKEGAMKHAQNNCNNLMSSRKAKYIKY